MAVSAAEVHLRQAIAEAPLRLARQALAGVGLELTDPIDQPQFDALVDMMNDKPYSWGACNFQQPYTHFDRLADYRAFSLRAVNLPQSYLNQLDDLVAQKRIDEVEHLNRALYSPIHTLHLDVGDVQPKPFTIFAAPDLPLTAVADADLNYAESRAPAPSREDVSDAYETRFLSYVGRLFEGAGLIKLDASDCAALADAIVATEVTL